MNIPEHLEKYLGQIERGWSSPDGPEGVQACLFMEGPMPDVLAYATLGLSHHVLDMVNGRNVRQELVMAIHSRYAANDWAGLLLHVSRRAIQSHRALLRGEVVPLEAPVASGSKARDLYVSMPVVFPEGLETLRDTSPPTVVAWLFPILPAEVDFISAQGWGAFEDLLEEQGPDLFDLERESVVG